MDFSISFHVDDTRKISSQCTDSAAPATLFPITPATLNPTVCCMHLHSGATNPAYHGSGCPLTFSSLSLLSGCFNSELEFGHFDLSTAKVFYFFTMHKVVTSSASLLICQPPRFFLPFVIAPLTGCFYQSSMNGYYMV